MYSSTYLHYIILIYILSITFFIYFQYFSNIVPNQQPLFTFFKNIHQMFKRILTSSFLIHRSCRQNIRKIFFKYFAYITNIFIQYILIFFSQFLLQVAVEPHFQLAETENPLFLQIQSYPEMIAILQPLVP